MPPLSTPLLYHAEAMGLLIKVSVDYAGGCCRMKLRLIKEDTMSKEKNKQKPNAKKKAQHSLKEKRLAKKEKTDGKPAQLMSR